jgi:hypothetical protein
VLDRRYDPFATGYNFDLFGLDSSLDLEDLARQIVDSKAISAQAHKEAKKMAYSVFYLWSRAQAQLHDLLKSEFGKSERSLINEYQRSVQQEKLIELGFEKNSMAVAMLPYGSLLFDAIRKTQVESTSFSVLHKLANQQKALDEWNLIEGSGSGSLSHLLDKLLEAKNATISLPFEHIQSLLMISKLSAWTNGDWSDWAARFYEDQTRAGANISLTPEKVAEAIRSHESLKTSTSHLGSGNGNGKSASAFDRNSRGTGSCKKCGATTPRRNHDLCKKHWAEYKSTRADEKNEVDQNLSSSARAQKEQKDRKKQRKRMMRAKMKERTKEAFAALKAKKKAEKAEANAVDRSANTIDVNHSDAVAADSCVSSDAPRKRKGDKQLIGPQLKRVRYANLFDRTDDDAVRALAGCVARDDLDERGCRGVVGSRDSLLTGRQGCKKRKHPRQISTGLRCTTTTTYTLKQKQNRNRN